MGHRLPTGEESRRHRFRGIEAGRAGEVRRRVEVQERDEFLTVGAPTLLPPDAMAGAALANREAQPTSGLAERTALMERDE